MRLQRNAAGEFERLPIPRLPGSPTPCVKCPKAEKEQPAPHRELSPKNWLAYQHFLESKATGQFPEDAIVRRNAAIILQVTEAGERARTRALPELLVALLATKKA